MLFELSQYGGQPYGRQQKHSGESNIRNSVKNPKVLHKAYKTLSSTQRTKMKEKHKGKWLLSESGLRIMGRAKQNPMVP